MFKKNFAQMEIFIFICKILNIIVKQILFCYAIFKWIKKTHVSQKCQITEIPPKMDLTPYCAIISDMDAKKIHQQISDNIKSQFWLQNTAFDKRVKKVLKNDLKFKRKLLDKVSNVKNFKAKHKIISEDYDYNKQLWKQFQVIYLYIYIFLPIYTCFFRKCTLKDRLKLDWEMG